ncbi:MAG: IS200/IS605 family transposase [Candidatus Omnitrophota bacterium]|nr:IS200/IS605 family transposase [Candidatus Omnitrophota bacterium]
MAYFHVWFVTKYRKTILEGKVSRRLKNIFAECIERHKYNVLELETNRDHLHLLLETKDKTELSAIVRTLKAVSAKELNGTPRFRVGNASFRRSFWARRYGSREIGENQIEDIREYIRNQDTTGGSL